ncbi:hypothetical protein [Ralstonia sp. A12]|uniref:hypothetical protein n=1 Tax=Ralstonia sp. A12 TaxID=1217052 RepID=UPI0012EED87E|nr:hypothetical protein [Ralstonia sp. A12]
MPLHERVLLVEGRASEAALAHIRRGLPQDKPANSEVLFVSFSYADIPLGHTFSMVFPTDAPEIVIRTSCQILAVTQQYAEPFGGIPHGWKTICLVKFEGGIPDAIASLPLVSGWYENRNTVSLCDEETWRLKAG